MSLEQIVVLALIQGITEFLPISSSGHLILVPLVTGWTDQGIMTDVMVHMGSFVAVVVYFWRDILALIAGFFRLLGGRGNQWGKLALYIVFATVPAVIMGEILDKTGFMDAVRGMPDFKAASKNRAAENGSPATRKYSAIARRSSAASGRQSAIQRARSTAARSRRSPSCRASVTASSLRARTRSGSGAQ